MKTKFVFPLLIIGFLFSCTHKSTDNSTSSANSKESKVKLHKLMLDFYLWYYEVPSSIDYDQYPSLESELEALKYTSIDTWSFLIDTTEYRKVFLEGEDAGYGLNFGAYNNNIYVSKVEQNSPAELAGVKRGFILSTINGSPLKSFTEAQLNEIFASKSGIRTTFQFTDKYGKTKDYTIISASYIGKEVFKDTIITQNNTKIGYIAYKSFLGKSTEEFDVVFSKLKSAGITELVVDLRDNGGGSVIIANQLIGYLSPKSAQGKTCTIFKHNAKYQYLDTSYTIQTVSNNLDLKRIFFLVNKSSASASELTITALQPYMNVQLIGTNTHGKPVGMEGRGIANYAVFPISVSYFNSNGYGNFFDGIIPNYYLVDNYQEELGNPSELYLKTALYYIQNGTYPSSTLAFKSTNENTMDQAIVKACTKPALAIIPYKK